MIFYITTHGKNAKYSNELNKIFKKFNFEYYFVYGRNQENKIHPYIEVDCVDSYENLPLKTYLLIDHFLNKTNASHLIKMDDDTFVDLHKIKDLKLDADYIGPFVDYPSDIKSEIFHWFKIDNESYKTRKKTFNLSYAEGSFYVLNRKSCNKIIDIGYDFFVNTPENYLGEDIKIGMCLSDNDITKKDITNYQIPYYEIMGDYTIIHPIHHTLFEKINVLNSNNEIKNLLIKYKFLNDNIKREMYLKDMIKKLENKNE